LNAALTQWLSEKGYAGDIDRPDAKGLTPVLKASSEGDVAILRELIAAGARLNARSLDGNNAIWLACAADSVDAITMLAAAGVDVNHQNPDGATALIYSSSAGKRPVVELLLKIGADATAQTVDGFTALDLASTEDCFWLLRGEKRRRETRV